MIMETPGVKISLTIDLCSDAFLESMDSLLLSQHLDLLVHFDLDLPYIHQHLLIIKVDI